MDVDSLCINPVSGGFCMVDGGVLGASRGGRIAVPTARPASFKDLTRSAMDVPTILVMVAETGSLEADFSRSVNLDSMASTRCFRLLPSVF